MPVSWGRDCERNRRMWAGNVASLSWDDCRMLQRWIVGFLEGDAEADYGIPGGGGWGGLWVPGAGYQSLTSHAGHGHTCPVLATLFPIICWGCFPTWRLVSKSYVPHAASWLICSAGRWWLQLQSSCNWWCLRHLRRWIFCFGEGQLLWLSR